MMATFSMHLVARCSLTTTLATSLPTVVGLAVWPCVRLSMGTLAYSVAMSCSLAHISPMSGNSTCSRAAFICSAWLVLLMSSLVQAKCTNSAAPASSCCTAAATPSLANERLIQYSTALTSWLVSRSMSLMALVSASV